MFISLYVVFTRLLISSHTHILTTFPFTTPFPSLLRLKSYFWKNKETDSFQNHFLIKNIFFFTIPFIRMLSLRSIITTLQQHWCLQTIQQTEETLTPFTTPYQLGLRSDIYSYSNYVQCIEVTRNLGTCKTSKNHKCNAVIIR